MLPYQMDYLFSYSATLHPPEVIGPVPEGIRVNFHVAGGEITGPRLVGTVRPVGADWLTIRSDGIGVLDVRATLETSDGGLVYAAYQGLTDLGEDGYARFLAGEVRGTLRLTTFPRIQTAHAASQWLTRLPLVGIGSADLERRIVSYDVYAVR
jgi:hypothetical protein